MSGLLWRHRKGGAYRIISFCLIEKTLTPAVAYRQAVPSDYTARVGSVEPPLFIRPAAEFFDGRFTPVEEVEEEESEL